jgi:hypothetical protein
MLGSPGNPAATRTGGGTLAMGFQG